MRGTGPHGRIVERDVKLALARAPAAAPAQDTKAPSIPLPAPTDELIRRNFAADSFEEIPHDSMRKTIARRLVEASRIIPHFYLTADCNLDALMSLRKAINAAAPLDKEGKPAYKISVNDFIVKALALALIRVPNANVTWTESAMLKHKHADVGVAVAIPGGLITPIVRAAETKRLSVISSEIQDFSARARARKLMPEEYQGGSSAVSNLGMFGIKVFSAIINPPQATILAVGAAEGRVIVKDGAPAVATIMSVTLSCDHRAVDGVLGENSRRFQGFDRETGRDAGARIASTLTPSRKKEGKCQAIMAEPYRHPHYRRRAGRLCRGDPCRAARPSRPPLSSASIWAAFRRRKDQFGWDQAGVSVTLKVAPPPGVSTTLTLPLCKSNNSLTMARPNPVPGEVSLPRQNGSKILSREIPSGCPRRDRRRRLCRRARRGRERTCPRVRRAAHCQ